MYYPVAVSHVYFHKRLGLLQMPKSNELEQSRPVVMLKVNIIVTSSMMEAIFATLHKKNTIVLNIKKWQIV